MKVILKEEVKSLGAIGSVINVADGYARNYLIPRNLAAEASTKNIKQFEHEKKIILERAKKVKADAQNLAGQLTVLSVVIEAQAGEEDKLFGSVTSMDIVEALAKQGVAVDKRKIHIEEPIKRLGTFTVSVKLYPEVTASISVELKKQEA
ncbi:MAG: 50S ribosomal protein L9 [Nitrospirae bacterium]|nr:50S ribosomal protein L9 [Nitrospirota bacterium]